MGKAVVDLPDPMQQPPPAGRTCTDDLLAQMAGEEIDRLLAEADGSAPPVPLPVSAAPPPPPAASFPVEVPAAVAPAARPRTGPAGLFFDEPVPAATRDDDATGPAFEASRAAPPVAPPPPAPADVGEDLDALFSAAVARDAADEAELAARTAAERAALQGAASQPGPAAPAEDRPLPLLLRPLEWLNAPLERLPAGARDVIGKIAIVTLLNAAAVLAYVMLFRPR